MIPCACLCRKHLLGEHVEIHMFVGSINHGISMKGYCSQRLLEPLKLDHRHNELVEEMRARNYNHNSPLPSFRLDQLSTEERETTVDQQESLDELLQRCPDCAERIRKYYGEND